MAYVIYGYKEVSEARVVMSSKYSHLYVISQPTLPLHCSKSKQRISFLVESKKTSSYTLDSSFVCT